MKPAIAKSCIYNLITQYVPFKVLKYFFYSIGKMLISKPVFIFQHNKIIIQLAFFFNKNVFFTYKFYIFCDLRYLLTYSCFKYLSYCGSGLLFLSVKKNNNLKII